MRACLWRRCNFRSHNFTRPFSISPATHERVDVARLLSQLTEADGVDVYGWVRSLRRQKKVAFVAIGDGSTLESVQAVLKPEDAAP